MVLHQLEGPTRSYESSTKAALKELEQQIRDVKAQRKALWKNRKPKRHHGQTVEAREVAPVPHYAIDEAETEPEEGEVACQQVNISDIPRDLLRMNYIQDSDCNLVLDPRHIAGEPSPLVVLSPWSIKGSVDVITNSAVPIQGIEVHGRSDVDDQVMIQGPLCFRMSLTRLHLRQCQSFSDLALAHIGSACPALTSLDLTGCSQITDLGFVPAATALTRLKRVIISGCIRLTDASLLALGCKADDDAVAKCDELDASHLPLITDAGVRSIVMGQDRLKTLRLRSCEQVEGRAFCFEQLLSTGLTLQRSLVVVDLSDCPRLSSGALYWVTTANETLQSVLVCGCLAVNDGDINALVYYCRSISEVDVSGCLQVTDVSLEELSHNLGRSLTRLDLSGMQGITSRGVYAVASQCRELKVLRLNNVPQLEDSAFLGVNKRDALYALTALEELELDGACRLSSSVVLRIAGCSRGLRRLRLSRCTKIRMEGVFVIIQSCAQLEHLDLCECDAVATDRTAAVISTYGRSLRSLDMSISPSLATDDLTQSSATPRGLTDHGLLALIQLPYLASLSLRNNTGLTLTHATSVSQSDPPLPLLWRLELSNCTGVTMKGLQHFIMRCPRLRHLDLAGCQQLDSEEKARLWEAVKPYLKYCQLQRGGIMPIPGADSFEFCDHYAARKDLERKMAERIFFRYRLFKFKRATRTRLKALVIRRAVTLYNFRLRSKDMKTFQAYRVVCRAKDLRLRMLVFQRYRAYVYNKQKPYVDAAIAIQCTFRRFRARCIAHDLRDQFEAAQKIQALARGYITRWVQRSRMVKLRLRKKRMLLQQLLAIGRAELPDVAKVHPELRQALYLLRERMDRMLWQRMNKQRGKPYVPCRFDAKPYAIVNFETVVPIFGGKRRLHPDTVKQLMQQTVHHFFEVLWPRGRAVRQPPLNIDFEPREKYRKLMEFVQEKYMSGMGPDGVLDPYNPPPSRVPSPLCEWCHRYLAVLQCPDCDGHLLCFQCFTALHKRFTKKHHQPRPFKHVQPPPATISPVKQGLCVSFQCAKLTAAKIKILMEKAKNAVELKKINEKKEMQRKLEAEAKLRAEQQEAALRQYEEKAGATVQIQRMIRGHLARLQSRVLREGRCAELAAQEDKRREDAAKFIQRNLRKWSVTTFLSNIDVNRPISAAREDYPRLRPLLAQRATHDLNRRRIYERTMSLHRYSVWVSEEASVFERAKSRIRGLLQQAQEEKARLEEMEKRLDEEQKMHQDRAQAFHTSSSEFRSTMLLARAAKVRRGCVAGRMQVCDKLQYWYVLQARSVFRMHAASQAASSNSSQFLDWLNAEMPMLMEIRQFLIKRLKEYAEDRVEWKHYKAWMQDQLKRVNEQRVVLDVEQELVLNEELKRLANEQHERAYFGEKLEELTKLLKWKVKLDLEKIAMELRLLHAVKGSMTDEGVDLMQRCVAIKKRQEDLAAGPIQKLMDSMDTEYNTQEFRLFTAVTFLNDMSKTEWADFEKIDAKLKKPYPLDVKPFVPMRWKENYRSQPWRANQRAEEGLLAQERKLQREALKREERQIDKQRAELNEYIEAGERIKDRVYELEEILKDESVEKYLRTLAEAEVPKLRAELHKVEMGLPKRKEVFEASEKAWLSQQQALQDEENDAKEREVAYKQATESINAREEADDVVTLKKLKARVSTLQAKKDRLAARWAKFQPSPPELEPDQPQQTMKRRGSKVMALVRRASKSLDSKFARTQSNISVVSSTLSLSSTQWGSNPDLVSLEAAIKRVTEVHAKAEQEVSEFLDFLQRLVKAAKPLEGVDQQENLNNELKELQLELRKRKADLMQRLETERIANEEAARKAREEEEARKKLEAETANLENLTDSLKADQADKSKGKKKRAAFDPEAGKDRVDASKAATDLFDSIWSKAHDVLYEDKEADQMADAAKKMMKLTFGTAAIRAIRFTVGKDETEDYGRKQAKLAQEGKPHCTKVDRNIGLRTAVYVWVELSLNRGEWLTHLVLSHARMDHALHKDLQKEGYVNFSHLRLLGDGKDAALTIWGKRDGVSNGIAELAFAFSKDEETRREKDSFKMLPENLKEFGLGEMTMWYKECKREGTDEIDKPAVLVDQIKTLNRLLNKDPDNEGLKVNLKELQARLNRVYKQEEEAQKMKEQPILYVQEFLAMTNEETSNLMENFMQIDKHRRGYISIDEFFRYVEIDKNKLGLKIFDMLGSIENERFLDFGEFLKAVSTFCMLGRDDLRKCAFSIFETSNYGYITQDNLLELLTMLHPINQKPVTRALKEMDLSTDGGAHVPFEHLAELDRRFPFLLMKLDEYQNKVRARIMGIRWWEKKLRKYMDVKYELSHSKENIDTVQGREERKQEAKAARRQRIAKRKKEAREATSGIRRNLLVALNMAERLML